MEEDINAFLDYLASEKGYSENTLAAYSNDLNQLAAFIEAQGDSGGSNSAWPRLDNELLTEYLFNLRERKYKLTTLARKIAAIKSFLKFMFNSGRLKDGPTRSLSSPRFSKSLPMTLSVSEVHRLLAEPAKLSTPEAARDKVMLELIYTSGLRVSELVALNLEDVNLKRGCVYCFKHGSGSRVIPIDSQMVQTIKEYENTARYELLRREEESALFLNRRGGRLTRQGFWQIVKNYASEAGLGDRVSPRTLRHSFATHKLRGGSRLESVQKLLGHAYISSTRIYKQV